jgi:hypothetical protein
MRRRFWASLACLLCIGTLASPAGAQAEAKLGAADCVGMTWSVKTKLWDRDLALVSSDIHTDAYRGDTPCEVPLPVLCLKKANLPVPPGITPGFYDGWTGGNLKLSTPVPGYALYSKAAADGLCASQFGAGWRMGEHHDGGGGWGWWAFGDPIRMWTAINDQPANPWNTNTGNAMTWTLRAHEWDRDLTDFTSDYRTDAYVGDTPIGTRLPVLCLRQDGRPAPPGIDPGDYYNGWARGEAKITAPTKGTALTSRAVADVLCASQFGAGWRMGEFHDAGGGWGWWAAGDVGRFWVAIDDQPANPWNSAGD